ncbi:MAG TPA: ABC transporter substrate-binding protein [Stellaceae bacterium]|nr:ABC transporter substrate-binding protein [Stellaceae bacterium]
MRRSQNTLIALCFLAAFGTEPASAATKLTFLYNASAAFVGLFVANDQGILAKHGLDIDFSLAQSGAVMPPALLSGSAQIGAPTSTVLVQAHEQGIDIVAIAGTSVYPTPTGQDGVVARTGSGLKGASDLVGHKVGLPSLGGIFEVLMRNWVRASGADDTKVQWLEVQMRQMGDALKAGLVDAATPVEPFYSRAIRSGVGYDIGDFEAVVPAGTIPVLYAATRGWATAHADLVRAFRASLEDANAFIKDPANAAAVRTSIAKYTKLPPAAAATLTIPAHLEVAVKPQGLTFWIDVMRRQGLIRHNVDPASLIAP